MSCFDGSGVVLGARFETALVYAAQLHRQQRRKLTGVPYMAHLMAVAALVLEDGGSEDEAIAALLHDAVEDQGGLATLEVIRQRFGKAVADLVLGCTQPADQAGLSWRDQKRLYLEQIRGAGHGVQRIMLADKLHNGRSLLGLLQVYGDRVWGHFSGGRQGTLWLYGEYVELFESARSGWMVETLGRINLELRQLV
ncbi:metal dependent phosphohydrolase [Leptolyngbya sp. Heron Island J]|uniref:HD domain-containing protein n=1 Tax=Leptolyngbya sp. Heron Island J TaxID=1385935 RepID=UPI0003B996AD|nr:HD domain-containing protein [Leptolyngbya sp. Heron Island J]ESA34649.1 metal dependent phosphohydrolase [Leptolyngbya sp. Heron Island J]